MHVSIITLRSELKEMLFFYVGIFGTFIWTRLAKWLSGRPSALSIVILIPARNRCLYWHQIFDWVPTCFCEVGQPLKQHCKLFGYWLTVIKDTLQSTASTQWKKNHFWRHFHITSMSCCTVSRQHITHLNENCGNILRDPASHYTTYDSQILNYCVISVLVLF